MPEVSRAEQKIEQSEDERYLVRSVVPLLKQALQRLAEEQPDDPLLFLADFVRTHRPPRLEAGRTQPSKAALAELALATSALVSPPPLPAGTELRPHTAPSLQPGDEEPDQFGFSVAVEAESGIVVCGAPSAFVAGEDRVGQAHVFRSSAGGGLQLLATLTADDSAEGALFGASVAIRRCLVAVGCPGRGDGKTGAVYVFRTDPASDAQIWSLDAVLTSSAAVADDNVGWSVAAATFGERSVVVAGSQFHTRGPGGLATIWEQDSPGAAWVERCVISPGDHAALYGWSVSMHEDMLTVGSPGDSFEYVRHQGTTWVYKRNAGTLAWDQLHWKVSGSYWGERREHLRLSTSVSQWGPYVAAGGPMDGCPAIANCPASAGPGAVFVQRIDLEGREPVGACIHCPDGKNGDAFGTAVGLRWPFLVIGAPNRDGGTGAAYIYEFEGSNNSWTLLEVLPAPPGARRFGATVAAAAWPFLLIGAPGSGAAPGDACSTTCGLVYSTIFKRR